MRYAGGDLGFVTNSSAFVVAARVGEHVRVVDALELRPERGLPLKPSVVYETAAEFLEAHGVREITLDHHYLESAREGLAKHGIHVVAAPGGADGKARTHLKAKALLAEGKLDLPRNDRLTAQLKQIRSRLVSGGGISIEAPRRGGAHGDVASAAILAIWAASQGDEGEVELTPPIVRRFEDEPMGLTFDEGAFEFHDGVDLSKPWWKREPAR